MFEKNVKNDAKNAVFMTPPQISTPVPPTPIRPTSRAIKSTPKVQLPEPVGTSPVNGNDDNVFISGVQDPGSDQSGEGSDEEADVLILTNHSDLPRPVQNQNLKVHALCGWPQQFSPSFLVSRGLN